MARHSQSRSHGHRHRRAHGFWQSLFPLRCPNCLAKEPPREIGNIIPLVFLPLRLLFGTVRCNSCLVRYYRLRILNWLFRT